MNGRKKVSDLVGHPKDLDETQRGEGFTWRTTSEAAGPNVDQSDDDTTKPAQCAKHEKEGEAKLLMIHQLWLWKLDESAHDDPRLTQLVF